MIGETIGHFEIIARIGRGGMGEVFVAEHTTIKTRVAVKVLHAEVSTNTRQVQRFFNEARAVARIQHAGIAKIFDVGFHTNQRAYLIMEHLEGETLAARIERTGRLDPRSTSDLARQIVNILSATHHAGIIHRDLKPENVFLIHDREHASGERVKLLDFGIAKLSDAIAGAEATTAGTMGTPTYMAPEQWSDSSRVDWRTDVYSLGCILYKMAAGRPPFSSSSIAEACAKHLHETPQPLRAHMPDVPPAIDALALRLLAKDPAQRVGTIEELEQELAEITRSLPVAPNTVRTAASGPLASAAATAPFTSSSAPVSGSLTSTAAFDGDSGALAAVRSAPPASVTTSATGEAITQPAGRVQVMSTTLSSAASIVVPPPPAAATTPRERTRRRWGLAIAAGGAAIAAIAIGLVATRSRGTAALAGLPAAKPTDAPLAAAVPVDAAIADAPRRASLADWLEVANPFVEWHGAQWLSHQVTRREYRQFLEAMPVSEALRLQPVTGWNDHDPMRPVAWVTYERAAAFCRAIHAQLPSSEQWLAASQGSWGLDFSGTGRPGPLQEWTASEHDGLVVVRGGNEKMTPAAQKAAARDPLMKISEAAAGPSPAPNVVAAEMIGFRCVR